MQLVLQPITEQYCEFISRKWARRRTFSSTLGYE
jgi:hypothetical protein